MIQQCSEGDNTRYRKVLSSAQDKLNAAINQIRGSISHSGETGTLIEQQFRSHLEEILPEAIGVSHGFVVDSNDEISRQMDIILYDKLNTPRIFASEGAQMFPVEATYACGEIKTYLNSSALEDSFEKCLSYKDLCRKVYIKRPSPITYTLFGKKCCHWQSIFFCIAVRSIATKHLQRKHNEIVSSKGLLPHETIDTIVALEATKGENMLLNVSGAVRNEVPPDKSIDLLPNPSSKLYSYPAKEPWALFIMLLLRYMNQASTEPIDILSYGGDTSY